MSEYDAEFAIMWRVFKWGMGVAAVLTVIILYLLLSR